MIQMDERSSTVEEPRAVSVGILKGGVGKSTIAINLAERLGARGHSVLFVDLDPDGHASYALGFEEEYQNMPHLGSVIFEEDATYGDIIVETDFGFDFLPSNSRLSTVQRQIADSMDPFRKLKKELVDPLLGTAYDYIVVDTAGEQGKLSDTAPIATGNVIIPIRATEEDATGLENTYRNQINEIREVTELNVLAIVPNDFASRNNEEPKLIAELEEGFPSQLPSFARSDHFEKDDSPGPGIRHRIAFTRAIREDQPLAHYDSENDQIERLDELADIVERGQIDG